VDVTYLAGHPELVDRIANWQYGEWGFLDPADTPTKRKQKLEGHLHEGSLPLTLIALESNGKAVELLGSADVVHHDLPDRPDLTPWLSCVYVAPEHRGKGVGSALTRRAVEEAGRLGAPTLYLCTWERESLYRTLGWTTLERFTAHGAVCVIMEIGTRR
jgi:GNAT superfamily N-acetyltransferase